MTDEMTRKPKAIRTAAISGTLIVPATNLLQCADTFMHAIFVVTITGQWSAPLQLQSPQRATSYDATVLNYKYLKLTVT